MVLCKDWSRQIQATGNSVEELEPNTSIGHQGLKKNPVNLSIYRLCTVQSGHNDDRHHLNMLNVLLFQVNAIILLRITIEGLYFGALQPTASVTRQAVECGEPRLAVLKCIISMIAVMLLY